MANPHDTPSPHSRDWDERETADEERRTTGDSGNARPPIDWSKANIDYPSEPYIGAEDVTGAGFSKHSSKGHSRKIAAIIISVFFIAIIGMFLFGDGMNPFASVIESISNIPEVIFPFGFTFPEIEFPEIELPVSEPSPEYTLYELRQIALADINKYRNEYGVSSIILGNAKAPQLYAEELAKESCIHHISDRGEGPMLRYKNNNDRMYLVAENIAGGYPSWNKKQAIIDANYDMMYDDAHANWGHRDNIIDPGHRSVSIGITFDYGEMVIVQDFEQSLPPGYQYHPSSFQKQIVDKKDCW